MNLIEITHTDLLLASIALVVLGGASTYHQLGLTRRIAVATLRMGAQLLLLGALLKSLFATTHWTWILLIATIMTLVAGREVVARADRRLRGFQTFAIGAGSMALAAFAVTFYALAIILKPDPWYHPQYAIPLLGMLLGNTMTAVAVSIERMTESVWREREIVDQRLMLGESPSRATATLRQQSIRAGLIPTINAMAVSGIVSLPGMMTGQILAGAAPETAVRYQILIWILIAAGSGLGAILGVQLTTWRLFDERHRLRIDRLTLRPRG